MDVSTATPIPTESQRERAYAALRKLLILQQLPEGERLREPEWASRLGVNRAALREAFARLEAEGLIERGPVTGYRAPTITDQDRHEILMVRCLLECGAIDELCRDGAPRAETLEPLSRACDELADLISKGYLLGASEADRRFHEALIRAAGNRRLEMLYERAPLPMLHGRIIGRDAWATIVQLILQEHRKILESVGQGDAAKAKRLMRKHLDERPELPMHS
jgi:DNA-binding GntR family transcriptional regulator